MKSYRIFVSCLTTAALVASCSSSSSTIDDKDASQSDAAQVDVVQVDTAQADAVQADTAQADTVQVDVQVSDADITDTLQIDVQDADAQTPATTTTEISSCSGFDKIEDRIEQYCDSEWMFINNDTTNNKVVFTHTRVLANCCGLRSIQVEFNDATSTYKVVEIDELSDDPASPAHERCRCRCVRDHRVTFPYSSKPVKLHWTRRVVDENGGNPTKVFEMNNLVLDNALTSSKKKLDGTKPVEQGECDSQGGNN